MDNATLKWVHVAVIVACVLAIAVGQLLFKQAANALDVAERMWHSRVFWPLGIGVLVYASVTLVWVWVLQHVPISRAYPFMALTFVIVPAGGRWFFAETLGLPYALGIGLICLGVLLTTR